MPEDRRLAAIMFTDIVGYTRLMGTDEEKAVDMLSRNRFIHQSCIEKFNGIFIKEIGDGILASFSLASEAVRCAIEIQKECKDQEIPLKIGIHEGEMIFSGSDVIGDGVNIASRLQEDAQECCINISASVYRDIKNKADINTKLIGEKSFKNVDEQIIIYRVLFKEDGTMNQSRKDEKVRKQRSKFLYYALSGLVVIILAVLIWQFLPIQEQEITPIVEESEIVEIDRSIAVLPFHDMSPNKNQEYFSDGMMTEILMHLYKIGDLEVTSRTSSMRYKETDKGIKDLAKELGVRHVLEGSVRKEGDRVRITVQLIDAAADKYIWAESYDEELKSVFAIQGDIAQQIAKALKAEISPEAEESINSIPTENMEAYNIYLQAYSELLQNLKNESVLELYDQVISLDPNFARAYADMGFYWLTRGGFLGNLEPEKLLKKALPLIRRALEIDNNLAIAHVYLSFINLWYQWDFEGAENEWIEVFRINPSFKEYMGSYTDFLNATGRFQEALEIADNVTKDALLSDYFTSSIGLSYYFTGNADKAIQFYKTAIQFNPIGGGGLSNAGRVYIYTGKY